jgi:hypothetical protein
VCRLGAGYFTVTTEQETIVFLQRSRRGRVLLASLFTGDPGAGGFNLPRGMAITCPTTGRTSQTSASTLRTGFGANAARARSVNGAVWGLSVESARTNVVAAPSDFSSGSWTKTTGVVGTAATTDLLDPAGANGATRLAYDGSGTAGNTRIVQSTGVTPGNSVAYCMSWWGRMLTGTRTIDGYLNLPSTIVHTTFTSTWQRFDGTDNGNGTFALQFNLTDATLNSAFNGYCYACQEELGKYPSSAFTGARAADVLSLSSPSTIAPGGYFDVSKVFAPHYATAEQSVDHNLVYFNDNNRLFLRQSDSKLVLRLAGANNTVSSALTWSRETALRIRARHTPREQVLEVLGATTGNGVASAAAAAAISLPATAYLLGSSTGAEESSSLYAVQFQRPI